MEITPENKNNEDLVRELLERIDRLEHENKRLKAEKNNLSSSTSKGVSLQCPGEIQKQLTSSEGGGSTLEVLAHRDNEFQRQSVVSKCPKPSDVLSKNTFCEVKPTNLCVLRTYEKRKGVVDHGKEFECLMCALYALKLSTSKDVLEFNMTTNNNKCGDFDDIEIEVIFRNGKKCTFLFQLKHKDNKKEHITQEMLTKEFLQRNKKQEKSKFYLPNFLKSISAIKNKNREIVFILYTNSQADIEHGTKLVFKSYNSLSVEECKDMKHKDLLLNTAATENFAFQFKPDVTGDPEELYKKFYFFANQNNVQAVKVNLQEMLQSLLQCNTYDAFEHFMKDWWSRNFVLTKHDVLTKLTELALSPYVQTISGKKQNEKTETLKEAIMKFEMTIVDNSDKDSITSMWKEADHDYDWKSLSLSRSITVIHPTYKNLFFCGD